MAFFERLARFAQRMSQTFLMAGGVVIKDTQNLCPFFRGILMKSPHFGGEIKLCKYMAIFRGFPYYRALFRLVF